MLSGLRVERKDAQAVTSAGEKKSKKDKKKERRKEQKKRKKDKATKAKASRSSSCSSAGGEPAEGLGAAAATAQAPPAAHARDGEAASCPGRDVWMTKGPVAGDDDFFSRLGSDLQRKENVLKPDPDKPQVSEREYNPFLRGELSNQPAPCASGQIPSHLRVGDGGAAWRKRAVKRQQQSDVAAADGDTVAAPSSSGAFGDALMSGETRPPAAGGAGAGWRRRAAERQHHAEALATRRPRSRSRSRRRSPSQCGRGRRRSSSPQAGRKRSRSRSRSSPAPRRGASADVAARPAPAAAGDPADSDDVMRRMREKYGGDAMQAAGAAVPAARPAVVEDANALGAMAMEAMLAGDLARYEELNKRLEKVQAKMAASAAISTKDDNADAAARLLAASEGDVGPDGSRVRVLEEVDASGRNKALCASVQTTSVRTKGRNKRGTANAVPGRGAELSGYYEDDNVSLDDLLRRERVEGVQDYDSNFAKHILKKGAKFEQLREDEDEAYALGWYEHADKKMDDKRRADKQRKQEVHDKRRIQINLENCTRCMESKKFGRKDAIISSAQHTYLCMDGLNQCILPGQVFIAPMEHLPATTELDETVWEEIRNYQKCLVRYFESENPPRGVIFAETAVHRVSRDQALLGAGAHTCVIAYPVEYGLMAEARAFWKKALDEAECEFTTQHKKVIETDIKGGVRAKVPKGFPFVHVDFAMGGGFAHVVDDAHEFPRDFIQHTIAGMCELTILDRAYATRDDYRNAVQTFKKRFVSEGFDWAQALKPS